MELEELRETWQSVKPLIDTQISEDDTSKIILKKDHVKSRLRKRALWEGIITVGCIILMALSPFWAPMKFPIWWLTTLCVTLFIGNLYGIKVYRSIKAINLWSSTNKEILMGVVSIRKLYRNIELATSGVAIALLIWLSLSPLFIHTWRMFFAWGLTILAFTLEYLWYRSNIRQLNNLVNWAKDI